MLKVEGVEFRVSGFGFRVYGYRDGLIRVAKELLLGERRGMV